MRMTLLSAPLLVLSAIGVWACADAAAPSGGLLAPGAARTSSGIASGKLRKVAGYVPPDSVRVASAVLGKSGGELAVGGYHLRVPGGAVREPTLFVMRIVDDGTLSLELTASRTDPQGRTIDAGTNGFAKRVTLRMSYAWAAQGIDPDAVTLAWVRSADDLVRVPNTWTDRTGKYVYGQLEHFSGYAVAVPY
ncbi:MAG TPA: hypothetical protein VHG28_08200 [Longimicrobiaceae bacterium]|nr:hypothetical protein [Longimicrobiaceae bacterium]